MTPTIFALSSAAGRAAIAVFRISGPLAGLAMSRTARRTLPEPRRAITTSLIDPESGETLDQVIAIWLPGPASYTGEDMVELHVHGGRAVVEAVGLALGRIEGYQPAQAGEFTRRAFHAGKLDLTRVEAIADLIDAETEAQRRQAMRQAGGALAELYETWRAVLLGALAHAEARIDFPDEDLPDDIGSTLNRTIGNLIAEIEAHVGDGCRGERLRDGVSVAIVGRPNVGKSSLLNCLAGREAAIVSPIQGTTRDVIEVHLDLGGYPAILADTAGLRAVGERGVEAEGILRARARAAAADITLIVVDAGALNDIDPVPGADIVHTALIAANKADLSPVPDGATVLGRTVLPISAKTGAGLDHLVADLGRAVAEKAALGTTAAPTRTRHRLALEACRDGLVRALAAGETALQAEDLRAACHALGRITGRVDVEDLLDVIFGDFCIGK